MRKMRYAGVALMVGISFGVAFGASLPAMAQQAQQSQQAATQYSNAQDQNTRDTQSDDQSAKQWGLTTQEYKHYKSIMQGPRGNWSPGIDPITALGLAAQSDAERMKYARMLVQEERARVEQELALQRAYDTAWKQMYPDAQRVTPFTTKGQGSGGATGASTSSSSLFGSNASTNGPTRYNVVVATSGCAQCDAAVKQLVNQNAAMDIWITDAPGDDGKIRAWASRMGIPPGRVSDGEITLNHAGNLKVDPSELPRIAQRQ